MSHRPLIASAALSLVLVACGGSSSSSSSSGSSGSQSAQSGGHKLSVDMTDNKFGPGNLTASAGKVTVTAHNGGQSEHEFVLLKTNKAAGAIPIEDGEASESASVGEIAETQPDKTASHTFDLKAGHYVFVCNVDHHYEKGMRGVLVVK